MRADNVRRLTPAGWQAALDHGVRRLVDLRFEGEGAGEPSLPDDVEVVAMSLFGRHDPGRAKTFDDRMRDADDVAAVFATGYIDTLESGHRASSWRPSRPSRTAIPRQGVVVHCFAGKDRTGIIAALLLGVAGVPDEIVAADYAASGPDVEALSAPWFATADSDEELALRRRGRAGAARRRCSPSSPGCVRSQAEQLPTSRDAGLTEEQLERLRARLVEG